MQVVDAKNAIVATGAVALAVLLAGDAGYYRGLSSAGLSLADQVRADPVMGRTTMEDFFESVNTKMEAADRQAVLGFDPALFPVIDVQALRERDVGELELLHNATSSSGIFFIKGHGVQADLVREMIEYNKNFFALETAAKNIETTNPRRPHNAYRATEELSVNDLFGRTGPKDRREFLGLGSAGEHIQFPSGIVKNHQATIRKYISELVRVEADLYRGLARALSFGFNQHIQRSGSTESPEPVVDEDFFVRNLASYSPNFVMMQYPEHHAAADDLQRLAAHVDLGMLTLLINDQPGLQVNVGDRWLQVPNADFTDDEKEPLIVVMVGEMLSRWTNGHFKAGVHKVVSHVGKNRPRNSLGFFSAQDVDSEIDEFFTPIVGKGQVAHFSPFSINGFQSKVFSSYVTKE